MRKNIAAVLFVCFLSVGVLNITAMPINGGAGDVAISRVCNAEPKTEITGVSSLFEAIKGVIIHLFDRGEGDCSDAPTVSKSRLGVIIH